MESMVEVPSPARRKVAFPRRIGSELGVRTGRQSARPFGLAADQRLDASANGRAVSGEVQGGSVAGLSHDIRNILTALNLYCDLLAAPAVLSPSHSHYADDLRLVARAGSRLLERITGLAPNSSLARTPLGLISSLAPGAAELPAATQSRGNLVKAGTGKGEFAVANLARELEGCRNLLGALAGPSIRVAMDCRSYSGSVPMSAEDLTRILINLVRNASEAMPGGGSIRIVVQPDIDAATGTTKGVRLILDDDGQGIAAEDLKHLFESGFTTKHEVQGKSSWPIPGQHGLGLAIVRSLVEAAGGSVQASSPGGKGARFEVKLPTRPTKAAGIDSDLQEGTRVQC